MKPIEEAGEWVFRVAILFCIALLGHLTFEAVGRGDWLVVLAAPFAFAAFVVVLLMSFDVLPRDRRWQ